MQSFPEIPPALRAAVLAVVRTNLSTLNPTQTYRARDLVGGKRWRRLSRWDRIQAGHVLSHEAALGRIPLVDVGRTSCNKRLYRLRS